MITRDRLDRLLRAMFAGANFRAFGDAVSRVDGASTGSADKLDVSRVITDTYLDTEDAATVLRIISGEGFGEGPS